MNYIIFKFQTFLLSFQALCTRANDDLKNNQWSISSTLEGTDLSKYLNTFKLQFYVV